MTKIYLLTGDIGGTNSRMSLYDATADYGSNVPKPLVEKSFRNAQHIPSDQYGNPTVFSQCIIIPFLQYCWEQLNASSLPLLEPLSSVRILATLATAGLVYDNKGNLTNLGNMLIDGTAIAANDSDPYLQRIAVCRVINDFVAQGYGCLTLQQHEVRHLFGPSNLDQLPVGPKVCIGAGTGLGECYLTPNETNTNSSDSTRAVSYTCFASEGGHVEYAPRHAIETTMFQYLHDKFRGQGRISVERVVSGVGLANVYEFLAATCAERIVPAVHAEFLAAGDEQGRVVAQAAHADTAASSSAEPSLCQQAMSIMMSAYGCEVGSAAMKWIPTGGLFVTGGLTPKNIAFIQGLQSDFMTSYLNKGRVRPLLDRVPLFAVMVEDLGVRGVHKAALMEYAQYTKSEPPPARRRWYGQLDVWSVSVMVAATAVMGYVAGMQRSRRS